MGKMIHKICFPEKGREFDAAMVVSCEKFSRFVFVVVRFSDCKVM